MKSKTAADLPRTEARKIGGAVSIEVIDGNQWIGRPLSLFKASSDLLTAARAVLAAIAPMKHGGCAVCGSESGECEKGAPCDLLSMAVSRAEGR